MWGYIPECFNFHMEINNEINAHAFVAIRVSDETEIGHGGLPADAVLHAARMGHRNTTVRIETADGVVVFTTKTAR